ncbi:MAG TPA: IMP dehydrogenase, partial [Candidatus Obscuribacterales bacterium]
VINAGAAIFHHRNQSLEERVALLEAQQAHPNILERKALNGVAVGLDVTAQEVQTLIDAGANLIGIEVAHAYHERLLDTIQRIGPYCKNQDILLMVGNFASVESLHWLAQYDTGGFVDIAKVSQGGGSACTTRLMTGIGKPTWQAVYDACEQDFPFEVIADGGIRRSGDLAKALGAGACCGMVGGMLSGTDEAPGAVILKGTEKFKSFRGMASLEAKAAIDSPERHVEGVATLVPYKGSVVPVLGQIRDGLQSSVSSCGFTRLTDFRKEVRFQRVSQASQVEAQPHSKWL